MANYFLTKKALEDLTGIWDYSYDLWSEKHADRYYELLLESFMKICENPGIGRKYEQISLGILGFKVGKHIIFYQVLSSADIEIIRILHGRMDLKSRLEDETK